MRASVEGDIDLAGILGIDPEVRNGYSGIRVAYDIDADATPAEVEAIVAQSQKRSAVYDIVTNPTIRRRDGALTADATTHRAHRSTDVVVIGGGQAGLAMSHCLTARSVDHVVLERGDVAHSWTAERWDSLRLLSPNWMTRLPGFAYDGPEPGRLHDGGEVADLLQPLPAARSARPSRPG